MFDEEEQNKEKQIDTLSEELNKLAERELRVGLMAFKGNYDGVKSPYEQARILSEVNKNLKGATFDESVLEKDLPKGYEGYVVFPHKTDVFGFNYVAACRTVLGFLVKIRRLDVVLTLQNNPHKTNLPILIRSEKIQQVIKKLVDIQTRKKKHKLIVVPAQLGTKYFHTSPEKAENNMSSNEIGLGIFEMVFILLSHPERLSLMSDFSLVCMEDYYFFDADDSVGNNVVDNRRLCPEFKCSHDTEKNIWDRLSLLCRHYNKETTYYNVSVPTIIHEF